MNRYRIIEMIRKSKNWKINKTINKPNNQNHIFINHNSLKWRIQNSKIIIIDTITLNI